MKRCNLKNCDAEHEGICTLDLDGCSAKSDDDLMTEEEWKQQNVIHCPDSHCNGMLLENDLCHELKCSKCEKYFMLLTEFKEVEKPKHE